MTRIGVSILLAVAQSFEHDRFLQETRTVTTQVTKFTDEQVRKIRRRVLYWGRKNYQEYPWRMDTDAWLTFVAELFLQRTQARQVEEIYEEFSRRYPTPSALMSVDSNEIYPLVRKLGLHFRLPLLRDIAAVALERGGVLPEDMEQLTSLKGVGTYTAAAWLSLHRGKRAVLIDSNVIRWLSRMTGNHYTRDPRGVSWVRIWSRDLRRCGHLRNTTMRSWISP